MYTILHGKVIHYAIYNKYETPANDTSSTNQETNGLIEITLVTCNNINKNRLIVKAKEQIRTLIKQDYLNR